MFLLLYRVIQLTLLVQVLKPRKLKKKKAKGNRSSSRKEQSSHKRPSTWNGSLKSKFKNAPISTIDIKLWMKYLKIKNFQGVVSRDKIINCINEGFYVVNLDDSTGPGTHWVAMCIKPGIIEYFDSFVLNCPEEVINLSDILGINYLYNSSQYQDFISVLCGYYCIYWINEIYKGKSYYDVIKVFDITDTNYNEQLIKNYFMLSINIYGLF